VIKIKKTISLLLVLVLAFSLIACKKDDDQKSPETKAEEQVKTEEKIEAEEETESEAKIDETADVSAGKFENEEFSIAVPEGWNAMPMYDQDEKEVSDQIILVKGSDDPFAALNFPMITVSYGGPDNNKLPVDKDFYEEAEDLESLELGGKTWEGYTAMSFGSPMTYLFATDNDRTYQISIMTDQPEGSISLEDSDVIEIIESFIGK